MWAMVWGRAVPLRVAIALLWKPLCPRVCRLMLSPGHDWQPQNYLTRQDWQEHVALKATLVKFMLHTACLQSTVSKPAPFWSSPALSWGRKWQPGDVDVVRRASFDLYSPWPAWQSFAKEGNTFSLPMAKLMTDDTEAWWGSADEEMEKDPQRPKSFALNCNSLLQMCSWVCLSNKIKGDNSYVMTLRCCRHKRWETCHVWNVNDHLQLSPIIMSLQGIWKNLHQILNQILHNRKFVMNWNCKHFSARPQERRKLSLVGHLTSKSDHLWDNRNK